MEKYFCNCLNIVVNVSSKETREAIGKDFIQSGLLDEVDNIDPFFGENLLDIKLGISGVEVSQSVLSKERSYGDWLVSTCLNCGIDTHAMHATKGADRVLLSTRIPRGEKAREDILSSPKYSKLFQINLVEPSERVKNNVCSFTQCMVLQATDKLNSTCKRLIQAAEEAKNERIRVSTENENQQFREFKIKANRDKEYLLKGIHEADESSSIFDVLINETHSSVGSDTRMLEARDVHMELPKITGKVQSMMIPGNKKKDFLDNSHDFGMSRDIGMSQSLPASEVRRTRDTSENLSQSIKKHNREKRSDGINFTVKKQCSDNDDILFDMEGYHNEKNCEPFFESDDESSGDATSLEGSGGYSTLNPNSGYTPSRGITSTNRDKSADGHFAKSLPVAVPFFNNLRTSYDPESDEEKESPCLNKIAASFKAVAKSMQDSTGMFGDLPPRRMEYERHSLSSRTVTNPSPHHNPDQVLHPSSYMHPRAPQMPSNQHSSWR